MAESDLPTLLRTMAPVLNPGTYVFALVPMGTRLDPGAVIASIREPEGLSVIVTEGDAARLRLSPVFRCAWITLMVTSDLAAVGLTAAFATALGQAGISCNVVAGVGHDHLFVPVDQAEAAMGVLAGMQRLSPAGGPVGEGRPVPPRSDEAGSSFRFDR